MKTITIKKEPTAQQILNAAKELGYKAQTVLDIPLTDLTRVAMQATFNLAKKSMKAGRWYQIRLAIIPNEPVFKVRLNNKKLEFESESIFDFLGIPEEEKQEALQILDRTIQIPKEENFVHPLSEMIDEEHMNLWGFSSVIINSILNPEHQTQQNRAIEIAKELLFKGNPILDIDSIIKNIQARYLWACMTACNAIQEGLEKGFEESINEK